MYTIYSPAHHKDGIIRSTKKEAENNKAEFDGVTTEYLFRSFIEDTIEKLSH
jgi:hypothetical protein